MSNRLGFYNDSARISAHGYAALAVLSNTITPSTVSWLRLIRSYRRIIAVCDSDNSGRLLARYGTAYHVVEGYKDLGQASEQYVTQLLEYYG